MKLQEVRTCAACAEALTALGVTGDAQQQILRETSRFRHAWRVGSSVEAARKWAAGRQLGRQTPLLVEMGALCALIAECCGPGGRNNIAGWRSNRHPAFACCGKGRKQASDGPAWSAAIATAAKSVADGLPGSEVRLEARNVDGRTAVVLSVRDADGGEIAAVDFSESVKEADWIAPVCYEGLRLSLGLEGWFALPVVVAGEPFTWAAAVNGLRTETTETEDVQ